MKYCIKCTGNPRSYTELHAPNAYSKGPGLIKLSEMKMRKLNILKTFFIYILASDSTLMLLIVVGSHIGSHIQCVVLAAEETTVT